ncbi:hypothetical protein HZA39_00720 [Candidatus Peregrinibacteria bacterium]|nr:hypothetical protein [Candidatus Peregrinibacteria bacterium]
MSLDSAETRSIEGYNFPEEVKVTEHVTQDKLKIGDVFFTFAISQEDDCIGVLNEIETSERGNNFYYFTSYNPQTGAFKKEKVGSNLIHGVYLLEVLPGFLKARKE